MEMEKTRERIQTWKILTGPAIWSHRSYQVIRRRLILAVLLYPSGIIWCTFRVTITPGQVINILNDREESM